MNNELLEVAQTAVRLYAETHPRPSHVNQCQAAEMVNLSRVTINRMVRKGTIKLNRCGLIPITEIDSLISSH